MPRNRVIYNSEALFAGQKVGEKCYTEDEGVNSIKQLHRVQNANYSFNITRTDVNQFGELAAIDRIITDTPTVALDFSYYLANFANEEALGLNVAEGNIGGGDPFGDGEGLTTALKFFLDGSKDQRNYFIQTSAEGTDANNDQDDVNKSIIGIGNGFLTSYSVEASVGGLPTASVSVEGLNMSFENGNILKASGLNTKDYKASFQTASGTGPVIYNANKEKLNLKVNLDGSETTVYSGVYLLSGEAGCTGDADDLKISKGRGPSGWTSSGVPLPSINPVDGTKSQGVFFLPTTSGHAGADTSGILNLSTLRPGDVRLYFRQVEQGGQAALSGFSQAASEGLESFKDPDIPGVGLPTQSGYKRSEADSNDTDGGVQAAHIQSFSLDFGLSRTPLQRLGVKHAFSREVDFPLSVSLSVDAILADLTTGNLADIIDCDRSYDIAVEMCAPADCTAGTISHDLRDFDSRTPVATYIIKNAKLDSESFSSSIGDNKSVTLDFTAQIGGPNQSGNGLFMKGVTPSNIASQFETTDSPFPTESNTALHQ